MNAVIGVLTALHWRNRTGQGQQVDSSLYEPVLQLIAQASARWSAGASPSRSNKPLNAGLIRNVYATQDGTYLVISTSTERHVQELCAVVGVRRGGPDPDRAVASWMTRHSADEALSALVERRIPVATVNDLDALLADPHIAARGSLARLVDPSSAS